MIWNRWRNQRNLCVQSSVVWWNCQLSWKHSFLFFGLGAACTHVCPMPVFPSSPFVASFRGTTTEIYTSITFSCSLFNKITGIIWIKKKKETRKYIEQIRRAHFFLFRHSGGEYRTIASSNWIPFYLLWYEWHVSGVVESLCLESICILSNITIWLGWRGHGGGGASIMILHEL